MPTPNAAVSLDHLVSAVSAAPGSTAKQLARTLDVTAKDVNPLLYRHSELFRAGQGESAAPQWFLVDDGADVTPYQRPAATSAASTETSEETEKPPVTDEFSSLFDEPEFDPEAIAKFTKRASTPRPAVATPRVSDENPLGLYDWQRDALAAWKLNHSQGIVDAVTGAGKTRLALAAIAEHQAAGGKTLVLVPTVVLLYQWEAIIADVFPTARVGLVGDGHDATFTRDDVLVAVLATARNRSFPLNGARGLLVADECHRAAAEKSAATLDWRFDYRLGLSATHERMDDAHETILLPYFKKVVFTLTYQRAIDDGVISNVRTAFVGVTFTDEEKAQYVTFQRTLKKMRRKLVDELGCRSQPFSLFLDDVIRLATNGRRNDAMVAQKWLKTWGDKKALLAETPSKTNAIAGLLDVINDAGRTLIFTQSITSANAIADLLREAVVAASAHHSEIPMAEREGILQRFADGELTVLASVQTLEEGVDVPDADLAIIVASSKQRRQMIQRMGRVLRRKTDGRDARFVILFVALTDEDPRLGAHETFVDELIRVARDSLIADEQNWSSLRGFLRPGEPLLLDDED